MYADTDFLIALIKEDDWLTEAAEKVYKEHKDEIWISRYVLLEIFLISYRQDWDCREVLANTEALVEVRDSVDEIFQAAVKVEEDGMTPMDAIHLVSSSNEKIISSDKSYEGNSERVKLEELTEKS